MLFAVVVVAAVVVAVVDFVVGFFDHDLY